MPPISSPILAPPSMRFECLHAAALLTCALPAAYGATQEAAAGAADTVYRHGIVYTVDAHDSRQEALAIRAGRIAYVGSDAGIGAFIGPKTKGVDLHGRMLMPGLVDGHQHPLQGGAALLKCNMNYEQLEIARMQAKIQ